MEHLIDKDALVAGIEKRKAINEKSYMQAFLNSNDNRDSFGYKVQEDIDILSSLNTLEVKEVDLQKELIEWHNEHFKKDGTFIGMSGFYLTNNSQMDIAKHFFELGLNAAQKGEEV